jgi:uncharacterized protein YceH (UPF0502 family)
MLDEMEPLSPEQLRVLGALIEKEATTPDQYPLTMNALLSACNQTSNRTPVVSWDATTVEGILGELRALGLVRVVHSPSNRAEKYRQVAGERWELGNGELAVLAVLALRGPQTVNELRIRTERYEGLEDLGGVEGVLHRLKNRYTEPWVARLERQPGQREERWVHLLSGEVSPDSVTLAGQVSDGSGDGDGGSRRSSGERITALEAQVTALTETVERLSKHVETLQSLLE